MGLRFLHFAAIAAFVFSSTKARAFSVDVNAFYYSDTLTAAKTNTASRLAWDGALMLSLTRKGDVVLGWNYSSITASDVIDTTTVDYSSTEMGPRLGYYFDKKNTFSLFATYNMIATAQYSYAGTAAEWRGTSLKGELGYLPTINDELFVGIKIIYYKSSFGESVTNSTTLTNVSYGRAIIYPAFALSYRFD